MKRLKKAALAMIVIFAAAQLVRPGRANPATDPSRTIQAHVGTSNGLITILDRSCRDCHSNETVWPWYTQVAPVSWLMASAVSKGRNAVNFSEWSTYTQTQQEQLLAASCDETSSGRMPGVWTVLHPEARLSSQDIKTICGANGGTHHDESNTRN